MSTEIAKRYAQAMVELEGADAAAMEAELLAARDVLCHDADVSAFFVSPRISMKEKKAVVEKALKGKVSGLVLNLVYLLIEKRRETILEELVSQFIRLNDVKSGRVRVQVTTSREFRDEFAEIRDEVRATIEKHAASFGIPAGRKFDIIIEHKVRPEIIGGLIIRVEDNLLNSSVKQYIESWRSRITPGKFNSEKIWQE